MIQPFVHDLEPVVQSFQAGQAQALQFVIDQYYPALCYFAERLTDHPDTAEAVAEASIARLWLQRQQIADASNMVSILFTHARDAAFTYVQQLQPRLTATDWEKIAQETSRYIQCEIIRAEVVRKLSDSIQPSH